MKTLDCSVETLGCEYSVTGFCIDHPLMKTLDWNVKTLGRECNLIELCKDHF